MKNSLKHIDKLLSDIDPTLKTGSSEQLQRSQKIVATLARLNEVRPEGRKSFRAALDQITVQHSNKLSEMNPETMPADQRLGLAAWLASATRVYVPLAALLLVVVVGGVAIWQSRTAQQPTQTSSTTSISAPPADGSIGNANAAVLQNNSIEQAATTGADGTTDTYAASANSLQQLGSSTNENF